MTLAIVEPSEVESKIGAIIADLIDDGATLQMGIGAIPDAVLLKPGKFTPEEFEVMKEHVLIGEKICAPLRTMRGVTPIIRHHHERWDGSGYPDRLVGDAIPYLAQVFQLIDIYDALASERPYKKCFTPLEALSIMQEEVGRGWRNPELFKQFLEFIQLSEIQRPNRDKWIDRYVKLSPQRTAS